MAVGVRELIGEGVESNRGIVPRAEAIFVNDSLLVCRLIV